MKVKHVLMIAAVLLAMFVAPVVADDTQQTPKNQETVIGAVSEAEYSFQIPVDFDFESTEAGTQKTDKVSVDITKIHPNHVINVSVDAGDDGWYLKHVLNDGYRLQYQMTVGNSVMENNGVVISTLVSASKDVTFTLLESATKSGRYEGTLTFTAEMVQSDSISEIPVSDAEAAQIALDNAVPGTVIQLKSGVDYGTLLIRPVDGQANTVTSLNEADGEGYTVYRNEYLRNVQDLTIIGAPGATVDAIKVVSGYAGEGSNCNLVLIKNLVIDSVEFTDDHTNYPHNYAAPIFVDLTYADVDGLTVKNCKLIGDNDKMNLVYFYSSENSVFDDNVASNIVITGNTVEGIARLCELRQTENVIITDNVIRNTALHGVLLTVHGGTYSGTITITGNTADGIGDRLVRMAGAGSATVVIKDNTLTNYKGSVEDSDFIKVTDSKSTGSVTLENNVREIYGLKLTCVYGDSANYGVITVSDKEGLLNLGDLFNEWDTLFCTDYSNFPEKCYYYDWTWDIVLTADIDFEGDTIDPIDLGVHRVFDGQGHTIKNAVITTDSTTENEAGLFDGADCGFKNLKLDNIQVTGSNVGNSCVGVLSGSCNKAIDGIIITNSKAINGKYTGGVVGYGYTSITNCQLTEVEVKGGYKMGGIIGYICADTENGKTNDVTGNTLSGCTVDGIGDGVYAGGRDTYIIGKLVGNYNCDGACTGNTVTDMITSASADIGQIEEGKAVTQ